MQQTFCVQNKTTNLTVLRCSEKLYSDVLKREVKIWPLNIKVQVFIFGGALLHWLRVVQNTAQLLVFMYGINNSFKLCEELLSAESIKDTTTGLDIFNAVSSCIERAGLMPN